MLELATVFRFLIRYASLAMERRVDRYCTGTLKSFGTRLHRTLVRVLASS